ncbi:PREDICTED: fatty acyl-CoA reductase 1-like, partial [Dinoponera quadriceps]|uniref:Fatty acyl-CoA reductase 1-like n=1 Tax=Dinoponera quadriceps TaxID=609295 RepID=A0A6P3YCS2_DINQU
MDNFNGPVALFIGGGKGVVRVVYIDPITRSDYIPVDIVTKIMIVAAWKHGSKMKETRNDLPFVYNCVASHSSTVTYETVLQLGFDALKK